MLVLRYGSLSQRGKDRLQELQEQADFLSGELAVMRRMDPRGRITMNDLEKRIQRKYPSMYAKIDFRMFSPTGSMRVTVNEQSFIAEYRKIEYGIGEGRTDGHIETRCYGK